MLPKSLPRKKLLTFGSFVLVLLLALLTSLYQQKRSLEQKMLLEEENQQETTDIPEPEINEINTVPLPQISFASYNTPSAPVLPDSVNVYTFRTDYTPLISALQSNLGLSESKTEGNSIALYNLEENQNRGYLIFNTGTGRYEYSSYGTYQLPAVSGSVTGNVSAFLLDLGLIDETVDCNITYQRTDIPDTTFVECHRDWNKTGLPIINFAGLLNIPDIQSVTDLQVGMVDENTPDNPNIVSVSTGQDGKERPNDYNTATVAVDSQGNLISINSNLKMIESSNQYASADLVTPEEAVARFQSADSLLSLIVPVDNNLAWETVFPGNAAYDLNAQVSDILLTYIENPFGGQSLTPLYLARGTATTAEGYEVKFLQAIPALRNQLGMESAEGQVAGLLAAVSPYPTQYYDESLKLGTFNPDQGTVQQQAITYPRSASPCVPAEDQLSPIISLGEFGMLGQWTINAPSPGDQYGSGTTGKGYQQSGQWFLIPANPQVLPEINQVVTAFDSLGVVGRGNEGGTRELDELQNEWRKYNFCPLRVSGGSPTLIGYGGTYQVRVGREIVYLSPNPDNSIYYEYLPVKFSRPSQGWNVDKSDLSKFAQTITKQLDLTSPEQDKLEFELNAAASKVNHQKLFVGLIPQSEVDGSIPLTVTPEVPVLRYHFYIGQANVSVLAPALEPLVRSPRMILELGAVTP